MAMRRLPSTLPGSEPLMVNKVALGISLCMAVVILVLNAATAAAIGAHGGHVPWPIVQWAVTTPLGTLAVALVGGLAWGLPVVWAPGERIAFTHAVDVTELPLPAWPPALPPWRRPGGPTRAAYLLGRGWRQRVPSLLALAFAGLLVLGFFAAYVAIYVFGIRQLPDCSGARCPPT